MLNKLPELLYNIGNSPTDPLPIVGKNLWRRGEIIGEYKSSLLLFDEHIVKNGERPEDIALRFYENPFYNWTILVANNIVNVHEQWPKSTRQLNEYVFAKYDNPQATKHYETYEVRDADRNVIVPAGKIVPSSFSVTYFDGSTTVTANPVASVSYYQYEDKLNETKSKIQIIRPKFIEDFVRIYYSRLVQGGNLSIARGLSDITTEK
tara:strand:- start:13 stop:633 length:621 start_codon:yes stop_codon:yes gene_type:complete